MASVVLILGGVRSGKSRFAQQLAERVAGDDVLFVATAEAGDDEMRARIAAHRRDRPSGWKLLETPLRVGEALAAAPACRVVLLDCLTLLASNVLLADDRQDLPSAQQRLDAELARLLAACRQRPGTVIIVSGEVGWGLVPEHPLGRVYRDLLGWANQQVAAEATATYLMVAGKALNVTSLSTSLDEAAGGLRSLE